MPRPRPLIFGAGGGGGGPIIDSSGSESLAGEGKRFLRLWESFPRGVGGMFPSLALDSADSRAPLPLDTDDVDLLGGD